MKSGRTWATSCQPLSMVSECPRLGISSISVILGVVALRQDPA